MANLIKFLRGSQTNLNNLIANGGAQEGAFYLTNDTHRLYVGAATGVVDGETVYSPVAVNQGIVDVANIAALPATSEVNAGEFYYAKDENVLCVFNGTQWIQINTPYNDEELKEVIKDINDEIASIKQTLNTKANINAPAFTGKATLDLSKDEIKEDNQLVTKAYVDASIIGADMTEYIDGEIDKVEKSIEDNVKTINEAVAGVKATADGTATLVGSLDSSKGATVVGYIDSVKGVADEAARVAGLAATQSDFEAHVNTYNEHVTKVSGDISGITQTLGTKANSANAQLTGTATLNSKAIATEEYADGVADTKANAVKTTLLGDAATYTDLGKVEDKIGLLVEADAGLEANFANYVTKANGEFTSVPTIKITDGETTTTKTVATTADIDTAKSAIIGDAAADYDTLGKIEDKIIALDGAYKEADTGLSNSIDALTERVKNLEDVTDFVGVTETELTDESTAVPVISGKDNYEPKNGDVVIYDGDEFVWSEGKWYKFGAASATNVIIENIASRLDAIDGTNGEIARIDGVLEGLADADASLSGEIQGVAQTVSDNKDAFDAHVIAYNAYTKANDEAVEKVAKDLDDAKKALEGEDERLAGLISANTQAVAGLRAELEWGSFDPQPAE